MSDAPKTCHTFVHWDPWTTHPRSRRGTCKALFTFRLGNIGIAGVTENVRKGEVQRATTHRDFGCILHSAVAAAKEPSHA